MPAYELNQHTLPILAAILKRNTDREKDTELLIEDHRQKAEEYNAECK